MSNVVLQRKRSGPAANRRLAVNPHFRQHVLRHKRPMWVSAALAGFPHAPQLSTRLHSVEVTATPLIVARFRRLAEAVDFPPDQVFIERPVTEATR